MGKILEGTGDICQKADGGYFLKLAFLSETRRETRPDSSRWRREEKPEGTHYVELNFVFS